MSVRIDVGCLRTVTTASATSSAFIMSARPGMSGVRPAPMATSAAVPPGQIVLTRTPDSRSSRSSPAARPTLRELRRGVDRLVAAPANARNGGDDHDVAGALLDEAGNGRADRPHRPGDVGLHHGLQFLVGQIHDPAVGANAGVGDECVETTEARVGLIDESLGVRRFAHIHLHDGDVGTEFGSHFLEAVDPPPSEVVELRPGSP